MYFLCQCIGSLSQARVQPGRTGPEPHSPMNRRNIPISNITAGLAAHPSLFWMVENGDRRVFFVLHFTIFFDLVKGFGDFLLLISGF